MDGAPELTTPLPGTTIDGRYVVEERIGAGATGIVLRVRHHETGRRLALKLLTAPMDDAERFRREAQTLGLLYHPNIVAVTDSGLAPELGRRPYLVTEFLEGRTLREWLSAPLDRQRALDWLATIAEAVDYAHEHGVLHRDLKPENVIVCEGPGETLTPKVLDFGLARWRDPAAARASHGATDDPRLTDADQLVGTPAYIAPEQIRGENAGPPADVYALGVIAYEMLGGGLPFTGTLPQVLDDHMSRPAPSPEGIPEELTEVLLRALAKDPAARPASARAFVAALKDASSRARTRARISADRPRRRWLAVVAATASLVLAWGVANAPWIQALEQRSLDWRFSFLPQEAPDPRLMLISIDEESLARDPRPLAEWSQDIGLLASRALRAGAVGIALDLMLPRRAADAPAFADLLATHAEHVVLAATADDQGRVTGTEVLDPAAMETLGERRAHGLFGLVNVLSDPDGVCRSGRTLFHDQTGEDFPAWATRAASLLQSPGAKLFRGSSFLLQGNLRRETLERVPWHASLQMPSERFRGRLLLVGGEFAGAGDGGHVVALAGRRTAISGLELQALLLASISSERPVHEVPARAALAVLAIASAAALGVGVATGHSAPAAWTLVALASLCVLGTVVAFAASKVVMPLVAPLGVIAGALAIQALAAWAARTWSVA